GWAAGLLSKALPHLHEQRPPRLRDVHPSVPWLRLLASEHVPARHGEAGAEVAIEKEKVSGGHGKIEALIRGEGIDGRVVLIEMLLRRPARSCPPQLGVQEQLRTENLDIASGVSEEPRVERRRSGKAGDVLQVAGELGGELGRGADGRVRTKPAQNQLGDELRS